MDSFFIMEYYKNLDLADIIYFCEYDLVWKTEIWKDVINYKGLYQVSDLGRIKSLSREIIKNNRVFYYKEKCLKQSKDTSGYLIVSLSFNKIKKTRRLHQLVAITFLNHTPNKYKLVVNHKNFIRSYNLLLNLEIVTQRENVNQKHLKSSSQYTGVSWHNRNKKWQACIYINNKPKHLGYFINELEAHNAYQNELKKI